MKRMIFAGAALAALAAAPAIAQQGGEGRAPFGQPQTRDGVQAQVQARFARLDANGDGFVTQDEIRARAEAGRAQRQERREARFDRLDSNDDGVISRAEFDARPGGGLMAGLGARAFAAMDLDGDGRVAFAEAQRAALQRFDRVDSNRDGTITLDERQAARAAWQERRED